VRGGQASAPSPRPADPSPRNAQAPPRADRTRLQSVAPPWLLDSALACLPPAHRWLDAPCPSPSPRTLAMTCSSTGIRAPRYTSPAPRRRRSTGRIKSSSKPASAPAMWRPGTWGTTGGGRAERAGQWRLLRRSTVGWKSSLCDPHHKHDLDK
jgi:hypothetical protein